MSIILGTLLAGGRGRRLGNKNKAHLKLAGRPLWKIATERLRPGVDVLLTTGPERPDWLDDAEDVSFAPDALIESEPIGPAGGLLGALHYARIHHGTDSLVLTVPVDAPFFPTDLVERMKQGLNDGADCAIAEGEDRLQPTFGIWKTSLFDELKSLISGNVLALHRIAEELNAAKVSFEDVDATFLNINTIEDLRKADAMAELWFARYSMTFKGGPGLADQS